MLSNYLSWMIFFVMTFMFTADPISAKSSEFKEKRIHLHDCEENDDCEDGEEEYHPDYEQLGEYKDLYIYFEEQIALDETPNGDETEIAKGFFLFKWSKKLKNWFKKRVSNLFVDMLNLKKYKDKEYCAYKAAKFKRKIDNYCRTGSLDEVFSRCDDLLQRQSEEFCVKNPEQELKIFKERVKHYYENHKAKPKEFAAQNDKEKENPLKRYSLKTVIGGLEVFSGSLIYFLPFPGCRQLGGLLVANGIKDIIDGMAYDDPQNKESKKDQEKYTLNYSY